MQEAGEKAERILEDVERYKKSEHEITEQLNMTASFHLFTYDLIQTTVMRSVFGASQMDLLYTNAHAGKELNSLEFGALGECQWQARQFKLAALPAHTPQ